MAQPPRVKKVRGTARVAFIAHLNIITTELAQGHTAQAIYDRHHAKLADAISYQQFVRYVRQLREAGMVAHPLTGSVSRATAPPTAAPVAAGPPAAVTAPAEGSADVRHDHRPRTFTYDGNPKQDDKSRLIGGTTRKPKE